MWLLCPDCGATLPSATARCPVCGRQPATLAPPRGRRGLYTGLLLVAVLAIGIATALLVAGAPAFSALGNAVLNPIG